MDSPKSQWVWADFNGLFGGILCLSHRSTCRDFEGHLVDLKAGLHLTAFMEDLDDNGKRDDVIASGVVEPSPGWLACNGSRWVLRIDEKGVRHESDLKTG